MAAVATPSLLDIQVLDTWASVGGASDQERTTFADGVLHELRNNPSQKFQENVNFEDMDRRYGAQFPQLVGYLNEWRGYRMRWDRYLRDSRDVASQHIAILRRFDQVFLAMVEEIQTDRDRLDVIAELQKFIVRISSSL